MKCDACTVKFEERKYFTGKEHISQWFKVKGEGYRVQDAGYRVQDAGYRVQDAGYRVNVAGYRVQGAGYRVQGAGYRVQGVGYPSVQSHKLTISITSVHQPNPDFRRDKLREA